MTPVIHSLFNLLSPPLPSTISLSIPLGPRVVLTASEITWNQIENYI